jgi:hypothetical protein
VKEGGKRWRWGRQWGREGGKGRGEQGRGGERSRRDMGILGTEGVPPMKEGGKRWEGEGREGKGCICGVNTESATSQSVNHPKL